MRTEHFNIGDLSFNLDIVTENGINWISIRSVCNALGISNQGQQRKLLKEGRFVCGLKSTKGIDGRMCEMFCIDLEDLPGWLWGISPRKVKAEVAPNLKLFQQKLRDVINAHLRGELTFELVEELKQMILVMAEQMKTLEARVEQLQQENIELKKSMGFMGKIGSYAMHSAKRVPN